MKIPFILSFSLMIIFISCNNNSQKKDTIEKGNYEITKQELKDKESKHPGLFLSVTGNDRHNLIGQMVVKGTITSKAVVAVYKDVNVRLDFYSKTGAMLETDNEIIYETINPSESKNFKTKYFAPKGSDSVALKVLGAKIEE